MLKALGKAAAAFTLLAAAQFLPPLALAQETTLTLGHVAPAQTTYQDAAVRFSEALKELSGSSMAVDIVPGGALGGLAEHWVQLRNNSLDLHLIDVGAIIAMEEGRPFLVLWVPYLFTDQDHYRRYIASDSFESMMSEVEEKTGIEFLGYVGDRPPRVVTTRDKPVTKPEDLVGQKIRTPQHPFIIKAFETWGAAPTPIEASEMLMAMKTGVVDGQDNGVIDFIGGGYAEANKYFAPIDYSFSGIGIWMSPGRWAEMSEEQRGWLKEAARIAGEQGAAEHAEQMKASFAKLEEMGVEVSDPDIDAFRAATDPVFQPMDGKAWPEGMFEKIRGL